METLSYQNKNTYTFKLQPVYSWKNKISLKSIE